MARITHDDLGGQAGAHTDNVITFKADGHGPIELPDASFIANSDITRDGSDLVLTTSAGDRAVIEGYFNADPAPNISGPGGNAVLTPALVNSFAQHEGPVQWAASEQTNDESPVGAVSELTGSATITRPDGTIVDAAVGSPIHQGDVVETSESGAMNIKFVDDSSFAVSENARMAIDEYVTIRHRKAARRIFPSCAACSCIQAV